MGIFSSVRNNYRKSEAAVVVQNLLTVEFENNFIDADPAEKARELILAAWNKQPGVFEGKAGRRPHKLSVAAIAFANRIKDDMDGGDADPVWLLCLGRILRETTENAARHAFSAVDEKLLLLSADIFAVAEDRIANSPLGHEIDEMMKRQQENWDAWFEAYKLEAGRVNPVLRANDEGFSIIDVMEEEPLREAFHDREDPVRLGRSFGQSFDISKMKG